MSGKTSSSVKQLPREGIKTGDLEVALYELKCAVGIVDAIQTAMTSGTCQAEFYEDALYGAVLYLDNLYHEFEKIILEEAPSK